MNKTRATRPCTKIDNVDWIGSLPDEVLTHILSFFSTKEAVQTCVLSKRWKNTWADVPILDIKHEDLLVFRGDDGSEDSDEEWRIALAWFERFMTGFLDNRAPRNLDRVCCVRYILKFEPDASIGWLDRVALLMPQLIDIMIINFSDNSLDVPDLVFSCASLQHLSMAINSLQNTIIKPVSINLPSLKILKLSQVELHDDFAQKLFIGCPSLERLILSFCDLYFSGICTEVLKELVLYNCNLSEQMEISCPALVSLCMIINLKRGGVSLKNMSSLVNVDIKLHPTRGGDDVPNLYFLGGLSNAAKLELNLGSPVLKIQLEKDIPNCRKFNNLKKLVVGGRWDMRSDFYLIACLLKHSPNLKELHLLLYKLQLQTQRPRREVSGDVLLQREYLETVKIGDECGCYLSNNITNAMIKTLGTYIKKIGNIIIIT